MKTILTKEQALVIFSILLETGHWTEESYETCLDLLESRPSETITISIHEHYWSFTIGTNKRDTVFDDSSIGGKLNSACISLITKVITP